MVSEEEKVQLDRLIAMAKAGDMRVVFDTFLRVYGLSYDNWVLVRLGLQSGSVEANSARAERFLKSYAELIPAFKAALHELVDAI